MPSTSTNTSKNSRSFLSDFFDNIAKNVARYEEIVQDSLMAQSSIETVKLQETMSTHPDWSDKVDQASVSVSGRSLEYRVDHEDAVDLEYGNPMKNLATTGLIRSTAKKREYEASKAVANRMIGELLHG